MDNLSIKIVAEGSDRFRAALALFPQSEVVGYREDGKRLILYWTESPKATRLPYPMTIAQAAEFVLGWLDNVDRGREPDHDGSNGKGWALYNEDWGHVDDEWEAFAAVEPVWALYGK